MSIFLKIKLKSLAAEARIIRAQELKTKRPYDALRESLHHHRIEVVRRECRATHLAYSLIRGRAYLDVERAGSSAPDWKRVTEMVKKYGSGQDVESWKPSPPVL